MASVNFPDWSVVLKSDASLSAQERDSFKITIRWFLGFCKRRGAAADFEQACAFIDWAQREKRASDYVVERWREPIRWFFRTARRRERGEASASGHQSDVSIEDSRAASKERGVRGPEAQPARLLKSEPEWRLQCIRGIRIRNFSYATEKSYLQRLRRFAAYWKTDDLESLGENEIKLYLDHVAVVEKVSGGTQRLALNALVFYYRDVLKRDMGDFSDYKKATGAKRIPVVLSLDEIRRTLACMASEQALMARLQFGAGLRVSELVRLRIKDVDFENRQLIVRGGKGDKDRVTLLPQSLVERLQTQKEAARVLYDEDRKSRVAGVWLPEALARKFSRAGERWEWFWFWPAASLAKDPRETDTIRRHHVHVKMYQAAITRAARALISG